MRLARLALLLVAALLGSWFSAHADEPLPPGSDALSSPSADLNLDEGSLPPNGQGRAVLDWLRQLDGLASNSPVWVVISALDGEEAIRRFGPLGGRFLPKPFDPWDLVAILRKLLVAKDYPEQSLL